MSAIRFVGAACALALSFAVYDVLQSNGVIYSVDRVLMPR